MKRGKQTGFWGDFDMEAHREEMRRLDADAKRRSGRKVCMNRSSWAVLREQRLQLAAYTCSCAGRCGPACRCNGEYVPREARNVIALDGDWRALCVSCRVRIQAPEATKKRAWRLAFKRAQLPLPFAGVA